MSKNNLKEIHLEEAIESSLLTQGGYQQGHSKDFDREDALITSSLLRFIKDTQPKKWEQYQDRYKAQAQRQFIKRFDEVVAQKGLLHVLRHGFSDRGIEFRVCFFKPETELNKTDAANYQANILECVRQLHYSSSNQNSIDIVLFLNGIPLVSMELKNQFSGQNVHNAIAQYRSDRAGEEKIFAFNQRVLVHFALDLYEVFMTTKLQGTKTLFLPFNQGSNGCGNIGGKGNPTPPDGKFTCSYLWENILAKDSLMEIVQCFLHLKDARDKAKSIMIFPRYHQLDVLRKLLALTKQKGSGERLLIQHSAGSGKSNSIAWLAHRLASLHDQDNNAIFNSIIVVTDRRVLDAQLRETISQFESVEGLVCGAKTSEELKTELNKGTKIIVTTLQKFPFVYEDINSTGRKYAIIIDEAHSSQTGDTAKKMTEALGNHEEALERCAKEQINLDKAQEQEYENAIYKELATHGKHQNLSFFAFTATPKEKTLELFGTRGENGFKAFHIYSMRQAIEEGFILDVLANYTTYKQYTKIIQRLGTQDKEYDSHQAARAAARFLELHPYNIASKTEIMLKHFMGTTKEKIEGKAKAMLVSSSRLAAVKYFHEFKKQIAEKNLPIGVLVAFSGEVRENGIEYTEEKLNKDKNGDTIKETALVRAFHSDDFHILIVAEKYQTGFDEPLLHTMFVDKALSSVKAVQTLSRLNRTMQGKEDTFVLDFVNTQADIAEAFQPFYEGIELDEETDPNLLYTLEGEIRDFGIFNSGEIKNFAEKYLQQDKEQLATLSTIIKPTLARFNTLPDKDKDILKIRLKNFNHLYSFITQIHHMPDANLLEFALFCKYLSKVLPRNNLETINLNDELLLEFFKLHKSAEGKITLQNDTTIQVSPQTTTDGSPSDKLKEKLSEILERINKRLGADFTEEDKVIEQLVEGFKGFKHITNALRDGNYDNAHREYEEQFFSVAQKQYAQSDEKFKIILRNENTLRDLKQGVFEILKILYSAA